jgi:hypothetical protein
VRLACGGGSVPGAHAPNRRFVPRLVSLFLIAGVLSLIAAPLAFAEGYNATTSRPITGPAPDGSRPGWGSLISTATGDFRMAYPGEYIQETGFAVGPHGAYTTTTNKCQDCHSTHYAYGKYMLLRSDTREGSCDFCHSGGGGSKRSVMMDNQYNTAVDVANGASALITTETRGFGTGHTLGYRGMAPDDINPAFSDSSGFSCFDCHTPHGNSARLMATFEDPGKTVGFGDMIGTLTYYYWDWSDGYADPNHPDATLEVPLGQNFINIADAAIPGVVPGAPGITWDSGTNSGWLFAWGYDQVTQNIVYIYNFVPLGFGPGDGLSTTVVKSHIYPKGRYLLLKNPDNENGAGEAGDLVTSTVDVGGKDVVTSGSNKVAIDWDKPLGASTTLAGADPSPGGPYSSWLFSTGSNERFPIRWQFAPDGLANESELCTDCHDGAAGTNHQAAEVYFDKNSKDAAAGTYMVAYAHDVQPREGCQKSIINPSDNNNFGPNCRKCHVGAGSCEQCHADTASFYMSGEPQGSPYAWIDAMSVTPWAWGSSTYQASSYLYTTDNSSLTNFNAACMDGGFSYPHRTLGYKMLKDTLWGIDLDGTPLDFGGVRGAGLTVPDFVSTISSQLANVYLNDPWGHDRAGTYAPDRIVGQSVDNLDSTCLDCHSWNIWNGSDPNYYTAFDQTNLFGPNPDPIPGYEEQVSGWSISGWELLLKGLP